jgi:hypothetical protein
MSLAIGVTGSAAGQLSKRLQKRGVIAYGRGQIIELDRSKPEQLSCECYRAVKRESDRLLPYA